jgi:hypothetical protein
VPTPQTHLTPRPNPALSRVLFLSLIPDALRTVLALKGSLRRAKNRHALDRSGPFSNTSLFLDEGKVRSEMRANPERQPEPARATHRDEYQEHETRKYSDFFCPFA